MLELQVCQHLLLHVNGVSYECQIHAAGDPHSCLFHFSGLARTTIHQTYVCYVSTCVCAKGITDQVSLYGTDIRCKDRYRWEKIMLYEHDHYRHE